MLPFCFIRQPHLSSSHDQQPVSETDSHAVSSYLILWPTGCKWQFYFNCPSVSSHPMTNSMWVKLNIYFCHAVSSHLIPLPIGCEWLGHWHLFLPWSHHISFHDQQHVSDGVIYFCYAVLSYLIPWPTACEWHWQLFLAFSLTISHPMTNSVWVTLTSISAMHWSHHISSHDHQLVSETDMYFFHAVSSHLIPLWPKACEWNWHLFLPCSFITSHLMTNRMWVTLTVISSIQSHHIPSHDQQRVSDMTSISAMQSHHISSNRMWVTLTSISVMQSHHISSHNQQLVSDTDIYFYHAVSSHLIPLSTGCEWLGPWHLFLLCSHHMTNSLWVTQTCTSAIQSHLYGCLITYHQEDVSDTTLYSSVSWLWYLDCKIPFISATAVTCHTYWMSY